FSVLLMQVDKLDELKARHGGGAVAAVMTVVARTLLDALRSPDLLGRWSDSQYLIVATECGETDAPRLAERLRKTVNGVHAEWWGDQLKVTLSAGCAAVKQNDDAAAVVRRADAVLCQALAGGDRVAVQSE